ARNEPVADLRPPAPTRRPREGGCCSASRSLLAGRSRHGGWTRRGGGRMTARRSASLLIALGFGYAFLYLPVLLLVLYSFNESRLVTVWAGFSTRWYAELVRNERILDAAGLSLLVAATSATLATVLGGLAGLALGRFGRFRGRAPFAGLLAAPLVMPEVLTGLSL